jgi:hypothetical protein
MLFKDDDELPSLSSAEYLTKSDHGKAEQREKQARQKGDLLSLKRSMLKSQVDPKGAAKGVDARKADEKKEEDDKAAAEAANQAEGAASPMTTKTLKQQEAAQFQDAQKQDSTQSLLDKDKQQQEVKKQAGEEYQQNMS